jgi:four helix bundle protein
MSGRASSSGIASNAGIASSSGRAGRVSSSGIASSSGEASSKGKASNASNASNASIASNAGKAERKLVSGYRKLIVWQEAKSLTIIIYGATAKFPKDELFGLVSQMRRAVVSVPANIAEGWMRESLRDKKRFLEIALGSLLELESHIEVANDLGYLSRENYAVVDKKRAQVMYLLTKYKQKVA